MSYCNNCGSQNIEGALYCKKCGTKVSNDDVRKTVGNSSIVQGENIQQASANSTMTNKGKSKLKYSCIALVIIALILGGWYIKNRNETATYSAALKNFIETSKKVDYEIRMLQNAGGNPNDAIQQIEAKKAELIKARDQMINIPVPNSYCQKIQSSAVLFVEHEAKYCDILNANLPAYYQQINSINRYYSSLPSVGAYGDNINNLKRSRDVDAVGRELTAKIQSNFINPTNELIEIQGMLVK